MKLVVANWKMNPQSLREALELARLTQAESRKLKHTKVVICPPLIFLGSLLAHHYPHLNWGVQNVFSEGAGAYTGEISPTMVRKSGVDYCLIGHSERRALGEDDELVNKKVRAALREGRKVILCVGEKVRDHGGNYLAELKKQLERNLAKVPPAGWKNLIIAYEPIWAIGGEAKAADTPAGFLEQALFIRRVISTLASSGRALNVKILYGGSVTARNAADFVGLGQADGLLVGRASLEPTEFKKILLAANHA